MRFIFIIILYSFQVIPIFGQNDEKPEPLIIKPVKGAYVKLGNDQKITDSTEAFGYIDYNFLQFNPVTKLVKVSYSNNGEWIPRGRGYFTLYDIQPYISLKILRDYIQATGDSTLYKEYLIKLAQMEFQKKISNEKHQKENFEILVNKYGKTYAKLILENKIRIGMTKEMVIESWGKPDHINRTVTSSVVHEQWVYKDNYLYFDNGTLTAWQD